MGIVTTLKKQGEETIFVQIAAYRDPELLPTLRDLFSKARYPDRIKVCIAWQHSTEDLWDNLNEFKDDTRVNIIDIDYATSTGACWARNLIQQEYNQEDWTLQLDSHHRFTEEWDESCITMVKELQRDGYKKPLLTSYIPSYNPDKEPDGRVNTPWGMSFDRFTPEGVVFFLPWYMEEGDIDKPLPARYYSAHFAFTLGKHAIEVQHDPEYYFHGEEITLAVRSYTHGYDLFHPNKVLAWHEYTRKNRTKQWDDDSQWGDRNLACHKKVRSLLQVDNENEVVETKYGLGTERTLEEYEIYSGIKFKDRSISDRCKTNIVPPGSIEDIHHQTFRHAIDLHQADFPLDDYTFCAFIFEDKNGTQIHREDMEGDDFLRRLKESKKDNGMFTVWKEYAGPKPDQIIIWSGNSEGWQNKKVMKL